MSGPALPFSREEYAARLAKTRAAMDAAFFEIAGCYRRYHCPLCRTVFLGARRRGPARETAPIGYRRNKRLRLWPESGGRHPRISMRPPPFHLVPGKHCRR